MDGGGRNGGRRLKDRLAWLLRPASSLLRSPCSSSSSTSTAFTAATTTPATSSSTSNYTTIGSLLSRAEPFSAALDRVRHPPPELVSSNKAQLQNKERSSFSRYGGSRRRYKNVLVDRGAVRTLSSDPYGFTTSDKEMEDDTDDEAEAFFSSRSLMSTDSSAYYTRKHTPAPKTKRHRRRRPVSSCVDTCAREPGFRPLVVAEEEVRWGLAVVKRSKDPYGDFRESMVEVIVGRQVFGAPELERLLESYLSLNAPRLHPVILQAFSDIWVVLHGGG
jgi:uncharacterized protein (TIGR01568 family)